MDFDGSDQPVPDGGELGSAPVAVKISIAGGFGVGKTTMVGALTEIQPLRTEECMTEPGAAIDHNDGVENKRTTTVAMDFGRITISSDVVVYLFGMPGQSRFWFMWDDLSRGALGAVVLADTRRLADCFPAIDYFEHRDTPFVVALNCFEGVRQHELDEVRLALDIDRHVPVVRCDARERESCRDTLVTLVNHSIDMLEAPAPAPSGTAV